MLTLYDTPTNYYMLTFDDKTKSKLELRDKTKSLTIGLT